LFYFFLLLLPSIATAAGSVRAERAAVSLELFAKGYLLGKPMDLFALAAAQFYLDESGSLDSFFTLKAGIEWATPWKIFIGAEGAAFFDPAGIAYMGGAFLGLRL